jgi:hypothetical protein
MNQFILIFRRDFEAKPSPEELQNSIKSWADWLGGIAAQNKLVSAGNRLESEGRVVKADKVVTNGPYADIKEAIGGFVIVLADNFDEAVDFSHGCPILRAPYYGSVEVRLMSDKS